MFLSSDARTNAASVLLMYVTRDDCNNHFPLIYSVRNYSWTVVEAENQLSVRVHYVPKRSQDSSCWAWPGHQSTSVLHLDGYIYIIYIISIIIIINISM